MTAKTEKTIFIVVARGFIVKTILRSGVLDELKKRGHRIVVLFFSVRGAPLPETLRSEFSAPNVSLEVVGHPRRQFLYRQFKKLTLSLVFNQQTQKLRQLLGRQYSWAPRLRQLIYVWLARAKWPRRAARWLERTWFYDDSYAALFDRYRPDLVFATSIISSVDISCLKSARRRGIATVAMPRGWDNINATLYAILPDRLIVQNETMRADALTYQLAKPKRVVVTGFPQFDWYYRPEILQSRAEFFRSRGLDPNKKLILWGSSGRVTQQKISICDTLTRAVQTAGTLVEPTQLLIRAHFSDVRSGRFDYLRGQPNVFVDANIVQSDFFYDNINPDRTEIATLANTLYHADVVVVQSSTLSLDALCCDRPVINTAFGGLYNKSNRDITSFLYQADCYRPLVTLGAVDLVGSESELLASINAYLQNPARRELGRRTALTQLAYRADGQSSHRVAEVILSLL